MKDITILPKEEITHEMIFDLWFKVEVQYDTSLDVSVWEKKGEHCSPYHVWTKVRHYDAYNKEYGFSLDLCFSREKLLNLEYAIIPKEYISGVEKFRYK